MPGPSRDPSKHWSRAHRTDLSSAKGARIVLPEANDLATPPTPAGVVFTKDQAESWRDLWATGPSAMWSDADADAVAVLVVLLSKVYAGDASTAELVELRHLRDSLGLSPAGRVRLHWEASA